MAVAHRWPISISSDMIHTDLFLSPPPPPPPSTSHTAVLVSGVLAAQEVGRRRRTLMLPIPKRALTARVGDLFACLHVTPSGFRPIRRSFMCG
jgi:hypothetical protein